MQYTVLVPLDGSPLAEQALPFAERLARATGARLILTRVDTAFPAQETTVEPGVLRAAQQYLEQIRAKLGSEREVDIAVPHGEAAIEILSTASSRHAELIVSISTL